MCPMRFQSRHLRLLLAAGCWLVASAALAQGPGVISPGIDPADDPLKRENHYKCYEIVVSDDFRPLLVSTEDQFGLTRTHVLRPRYLCNPVSKNAEGVPEKDVHQVCYEIRDDPPPPLPGTLLIRNQFGEMKIHRLADASLLCVPSYKFHV